jgi:hypothetical protein
MPTAYQHPPSMAVEGFMAANTKLFSLESPVGAQQVMVVRTSDENRLIEMHTAWGVL